MYNPNNDPNSIYYIDDSRDPFYGDDIPGLDEF
jgi:hypothetical protein